MKFILNLFETKWSELSALFIRKTVIFDSVYTLASANTNQSAPNLANILLYMTNRSQMILIMGLTGHKQPVFLPLKFEKFRHSTLFTI